jgi:hypothetical protein
MSETCLECIHIDHGMCKLKPCTCLNYDHFQWSPMIQVSQTDFENKYVSRISYDALRTRAESAEAKVRELEAAARWIPIEDESKLTDYDWYLVTGNGLVSVGYYKSGWGTWTSADEGRLPFEVTHYQPLPQPPKPEEPRP